MTEALAPLAHEFARRSAAEVERIDGESADRVRRIAAEAAAEARRREGVARAEGRRAAAREAERELLAARRRATEVVQGERARVVALLRDECLGAAGRLRGSERYPGLERTLVEMARRALGADCEVERDPGGRGGIVATAGTRRLDLTLPALVDAALGGLGPKIEELWR